MMHSAFIELSRVKILQQSHFKTNWRGPTLCVAGHRGVYTTIFFVRVLQWGVQTQSGNSRL